MTTAYGEGWTACKKTNGLREPNPYTTGTREATDWEEGWFDCMNEIKSMIDDEEE